MYFTSIHSTDNFKSYPEAVQRAISFLKSRDFTTAELGTYEIEGKSMYANVFEVQTGSLEEKKPEAHESYIDVQFLVTGREKLGFTPDTGNYIEETRKEAEDLIFYQSVENESFVVATPGCISVFFPHDIHRPAVCDTEPMLVRKVVVKVHVDLL